jgi:plastocyanin
VIWLRTGLLILFVGIALVALVEAVDPPAPTLPTGPATPAPVAAAATLGPAQAPGATDTRPALPTAPPQLVSSRIARETSLPGPPPTRSAEPQVTLVDNGYLPGQLSIGAGARVSWVNRGSEGHDVTGGGPDGPWRSGPLAPQESYDRVFTQPGTYDYACSVHPEMRGRVVVQP